MSTNSLHTTRFGYVLIELIIAVTIFAGYLGMMAQLHTHWVTAQYEAEQYHTAINYASNAFADMRYDRYEQGIFTIETNEQPIEHGMPYRAITVTVTWPTKRGTSIITLQGGRIHEDKTSTRLYHD